MEKPFKKGLKVVWLVTQLISELENFYWSLSCKKWQGAIRNKKIEDIVWAAIIEAKSIANEDVLFLEDMQVALVKSSTSANDTHVVEKFMGEDCFCTCGSGTRGNTCKH